MQLDPDLQRLARTLPRGADHDVPDAEYPLYRAATMATLAATVPAPDPAVTEEDHVVPGPPGGPPVRVRLYMPAGLRAPSPALFWIHGGSFSLGSIEADDVRCRRYAKDARCVVVSVGYRLAPEHPYPAGLEDCWAALSLCAKAADDLGIDPARLAIGGCDAGGALAAACALRARDRSGPALCFQLLVYPALDDRLETPSSTGMTDPPLGTRGGAVAMWRRYLQSVVGDAPPDAAPGRATDLRGLPPTYILAAQYDVFRDENVEFAHRLQSADVPTELHVFPGAFHGFESLAFKCDVIRRAHDEQARVLQNGLGIGV
jgi:acetyl esterase/lipase